MDREELLKEIFELAPDLQAKENEVRTLVFSMLEQKPLIVPDVMMRAVVRTRLLARFETDIKSIKSPWTDWLWYLAPVGAAAVIILMMIPNYQGQPAPYLPLPESDPVIRSGGARTMNDGNLTMPVSESAAKMESFEADSAANYGTFSIDLSPQKAGSLAKIGGVVSDSPVFVGVHVVGVDEPLGVSKLILPGDTAPFTISLNAPMRVGGNYEVVLWVDNGDGVFNKLVDTTNSVSPIVIVPK
jgi:hypothetical protein